MAPGEDQSRLCRAGARWEVGHSSEEFWIKLGRSKLHPFKGAAVPEEFTELPKSPALPAALPGLRSRTLEFFISPYFSFIHFLYFFYYYLSVSGASEIWRFFTQNKKGRLEHAKIWGKTDGNGSNNNNNIPSSCCFYTRRYLLYLVIFFFDINVYFHKGEKLLNFLGGR